MHSAPPVVFPVGRFAWGLGLLMLLAASGLALSALALAQPSSSWRQALLPVSGLLGLALALLLWRYELLDRGQLCWDGQAWSLVSHRFGGHVQVQVGLCWDAGQGLLLRVSGPHWRLPRYAWLQASDSPLHWHGLRCAVHAQDTL